MIKEISLKNTLDSAIPVSRFNRGEASCIFEEVKEAGCKVVVKNNVPACILLSPERFAELIETIEDYYLLQLAEERIKRDTGIRWTFEEILAEDGLTVADLDAMEDVELE